MPMSTDIIELQVIKTKVKMITGECQDKGWKYTNGAHMIESRHVAKMLMELSMYLDGETYKCGHIIDSPIDCSCK